MSADLHVEWGDITVLTISNPGRANSVTPDLVTKMARTFRRIDADDDTKAVILTGEGKHFCAGADISNMRRIFADMGMDAAVDYMIDVWMPSVQRAALAVWSCGKPTVAAINGPATAGGLDFALACAYSIAVPEAKLGQSYVNLGLVPVAAGIHHLQAQLPSGIAHRVLLSGRTRSAAEMHHWGLIDELAAADLLLATARAVAEELSSAPLATRRAYERLLKLGDGSFERHLAQALHANTMLLQDEQVRSRFAAVLAGEPGKAPPPPADEGSP